MRASALRRQQLEEGTLRVLLGRGSCQLETMCGKQGNAEDKSIGKTAAMSCTRISLCDLVFGSVGGLLGELGNDVLLYSRRLKNQPLRMVIPSK